MATTKRERQKANRQLRLQEMAKQARSGKRKRRFIWIGVLVAAVVALAGISVLLSDDDKKPVTVSELVSGIERRQRGLDAQQEEVQARATKWFAEHSD